MIKVIIHFIETLPMWCQLLVVISGMLMTWVIIFLLYKSVTAFIYRFKKTGADIHAGPVEINMKGGGKKRK